MYLLTTGLNPSEDFIQHHGILGMKWGVHRYKDSKGNLTQRGKNRFKEVSESNILKATNRRAARAHMARKWNAAKSYEKSHTKLAEKYEKLGKTDEAKVSRKAAKMASVIAKKCERNFRDIERGKIKAGRDFIAQKDVNWWVLLSTNDYNTHFKDKSRNVETATGATAWTSDLSGMAVSALFTDIYAHKLRKAIGE